MKEIIEIRITNEHGVKNHPILTKDNGFWEFSKWVNWAINTSLTCDVCLIVNGKTIKSADLKFN